MKTPIELQQEGDKMRARWSREYTRMLRSAAALRKIDKALTRLAKRTKEAKRRQRDDKARYAPLPIDKDNS